MFLCSASSSTELLATVFVMRFQKYLFLREGFLWILSPFASFDNTCMCFILSSLVWMLFVCVSLFHQSSKCFGICSRIIIMFFFYRTCLLSVSSSSSDSSSTQLLVLSCLFFCFPTSLLLFISNCSTFPPISFISTRPSFIFHWRLTFLL